MVRTTEHADAHRTATKLPADRSKLLLIPAVTILLAYLLRTFSLDLQSFWIDEVQAFYFVDHPFKETVKLLISPENNGPLYFLMLWGWRQVVGVSDFAIRYMSDLLSVLTVAVLWQLARTWFGRRVAGLTALLLAISPFAIWFGQEAKMYALHMALAALSTLLLVRASRRNRWYLWFAYGITLNLLGYSHFFGAFTIAAQGILLVATHLSRLKLKITRNYVLTMAIVALPYIPVVRYALRLIPNFHMQDVSKGFVEMRYILQELASEYLLRVSRIYVQHLWPLMTSAGVALVLGLFRAWRYGWRRGLWVTGLMILPVAIFYPISYYVPVFSPKYLSAIFLMVTLALALAIDQLRSWWRPLGWLGLAGIVALNGWANVRILTNPYYQRTDFKATVAYIEDHAAPGDMVITYAHYVDRAIKRYQTGTLPVVRFQGDAYQPEPFYQDVLEKQNDVHTLWLVLHQDQAMAPQNRLRDAAGVLYPQITGVYPNDGQVAVLGFSVRWHHDRLPDTATPVDAAFENGLALVGYQVDTQALQPTDDLLHPPSNWIHVITYWQRRGAPPSPEDFTPFVRLVDDQGGIWGGELQRPPTVFHRDPPANWDETTIVEAHYDVNLNPVTPPGTYHLIVGIEDGSAAQVPVKGGDTVADLTTIQILP